MRLRTLSFAIIVLAVISISTAGDITNFEDLALDVNSYWNGSDSSGGFASGEAYFSNYYDSTWGEYWDGFSYSNISDTETDEMTGQYNSITGGGQGNSANYAVSFAGWAEQPTITLNTPQTVAGLHVTNNNYTYYTILNGNPFAKKFGGESGDDEDWFLLTITGKDADGAITGAVDFYLADYISADNGLDYVLDTWEFVDLTSLGVVKSLEFSLSSSDVGAWGMNTPAYFALDTIVSEPTPLMLAIRNIEEARDSKIEAIEAVKAALAKEREAKRALDSLLKSDELDDLGYEDIQQAKAKVHLAIVRERTVKRTLLKSLGNLEDALSTLTGESD